MPRIDTIALVLTVAGGVLNGCMLATPATGLCLTTTCRDFEAKRTAQAAPTVQDQSHKAPDFELVYPGDWGMMGTAARDEAGQDVIRPLLDQTDPSGLSTLRVSVGRSIPVAEGGSVAESLRVITINRPLAPGTPQASSLDELARLTTRQNFQDTAEVVESAAKLAGLPCYQVSVVGLPRNGGGLAMRMVTRALTHRSRGYLARLSVPELRYAAAATEYDRVFEGFTLLDGDPIYPLPAEPAAAGTATGTVAPTEAGAATGTLSPTAVGAAIGTVPTASSAPPPSS